MADEPKILLFGANGQLGFELREALAQLGEVHALTRQDLDLGAYLSCPEQLQVKLQDNVDRIKPLAIVNAAAYTAVDKAESEPELAEFLNAAVPAMLARAATNFSTKLPWVNSSTDTSSTDNSTTVAPSAGVSPCLIHYSSDYVFDGRHEAYCDEATNTNPLSTYGRSKLHGEQAIAQFCPRHLIFRTSWVVGQHGGNFLKTMLKLAQTRDTLSVVADQRGAPTSAALIAQVTAQVLRIMLWQETSDARWGIYHLVAGGETSWHHYAQYVLGQAQLAGISLKLRPEDIQAIKTSEFPTPASRPLNSRLATQKIKQTFGVGLPDWQLGVDQVLRQVLPQIAKAGA